MSARSLAKHALSALNTEKPHSSITDWVEILTAHTIEDEAYDGIPELVDSINLQPTGPAEASRAIRKKLKHGDSHRQYRALVILKALVENGGQRFQTSFADNQLTDALKLLAADPGLDPKVRRKLTQVLASWFQQFKTDPKMSVVANLYKTIKDASGTTLYEASDGFKAQQAVQREKGLQKERERLERDAQREKERQETRERVRKEKDEAKMKKNAQKAQVSKSTRPARRTFNFEVEKPKVLNTIVEASQASNNLVNALQLVNRDQESVQNNTRVQECLAQLKHVRKLVVRYVQLVEDEQFIGTLIDTNERVIAALETYDNICRAEIPVKENEGSLVDGASSELAKLQLKQRDRVVRSVNRSKEALSSSTLYPDLEDLSFGNLGTSNSALPPPLRPSAPDSPTNDNYQRGSLSDYSDYSSSDEEQLYEGSSSKGANRRGQGDGYSDEDNEDDDDFRHASGKGGLDASDDPFADPFADQDDVGTPGISDRKALHW